MCIPSEAAICNIYAGTVSLSSVPMLDNKPLFGPMENTFLVFPMAIEYVTFPFSPSSLSTASNYSKKAG